MSWTAVFEEGETPKEFKPSTRVRTSLTNALMILMLICEDLACPLPTKD